MFDQSEGQASSSFEPPPWADQPASPANPDQESGAPGDPAYPTYQPPDLPDHSRDRHSGEPDSVVADQHKRLSWTVGDWLRLALFGVIIFLIGLPAALIVVLDSLPVVGDWLTAHVPFWDEVTDFYDWLFS